MTFYEAALRVLEEAGAPLHSEEITKRSLEKGLLSHVGKLPEVTMLSRLASLAKRSRDRRLMVTAKDTFALTDWMLNEDADALAQTGVFEPNPEEGLPPLRSTERHPEPRAEYLRTIGRQVDRHRRREEDGKRKKYPPTAEVVFEQLSEGNIALPPSELLARLKARDAIGDEMNIGAMLEALAEDNQKRVDQGRRPQFLALKSETGELQLTIESSPAPEGALSSAEAQAQFCQLVRLPLTDGRFVTKTERAAVPVVPVATGDEADLTHQAKQAVRDAKRAMGRLVRKYLSEVEVGAFEKACVKLLHANHFRELKVARRSKEGLVMSARRRDGSLELRYAVRLIRSGTIERRQVQDLRRDLSSVGAQVGLLVSPGDVRSEAKAEATQGTLVFLWAGDALGDKFVEAELGVTATQVALFELDAGFFERMKVEADESARRRDERHLEREKERARVRQEPPKEATSEPAAEAAAEAGGDDGPDDDGPGDEAEGTGAAGEPGGEGRRRRRRRRRRRGGRGEASGVAAVPGLEAPIDSTSASADEQKPAAIEAPIPAELPPASSPDQES
jgi:ribonuclease E